MLKAMRFSMPNEAQLDLHFDVDGSGICQLGDKAKTGTEVQLLKVTIEECECAPYWLL
jgi:hypothetical protein